MFLATSAQLQCVSLQPAAGSTCSSTSDGLAYSNGRQENKEKRERPVRLLVGLKRGPHAIQDLLAEIVIDDGAINAVSRNLVRIDLSCQLKQVVIDHSERLTQRQTIRFTNEYTHGSG